MKRIIKWLGAACLLGLSGLIFITLFGDNVRKLFGASAPALAGEPDMRATKSLRAFGQNEEMAEMDAPAPVMAPPMGGVVGGVMAPTSAPAPQMKSGNRGGPARDSEGAPAAEAAASRSWFPETFLFEPLVVTDASGEATVPVRVPDRLTNWRVLALAHSRSGAQAGAVTRFAGTLPTYVDPVLPPFLRAGDAARLPVQVVNTTDAAVEAPLKVEAEGAVVEGGARTVRVPARGSVVEYVTVRAAGPGGPVAVRATLGGTDAVLRNFDVWPTGRPVLQTSGGTLAAPRKLTLAGPADAQAGSERVRLLVYPGALGLLRSELASAGGRSDVSDVAYALLLAGRAPGLLAALGEPQAAEALKSLSPLTPGGRVGTGTAPEVGVDVEGMRTLLAQSTQRALRLGRSPDVATAALLAEGALAHPDNVVLSRLGERLALWVASSQRPDGTCQGNDGWTLQRVLVATAECARAVNAASHTPEGKRRAALFMARASGVVERNRAHVQDAYTAAALLAGGMVQGALADELRKQVDLALIPGDHGGILPVDRGIVNAAGHPPSELEATALAVLALEGKGRPEVMAELGSTLMAGYSPALGWGGGTANRLALQAVLALFKDPLPPQVHVVLEKDGATVTEGTFDAKALREVLALEAAAPGSGGEHAWTVRAEPPVPGLGFSLALTAAVPWKAQSQGGLELVVQGPREARVGQPAEVLLQAATPSGLELELRHGLPAGVQVDPASLDALVADGRVSSWDAEDGAVTLKLPPRAAGEPFQARFRVIPTLAGTLQGGASTLKVVARPDLVSHVPPATWAVR